ncbi:MAG: hypothetical protein LBS01_04230 [Prevotellaceae bacterium]|jgi:hypothetical protein|nr:hypothetical protein [Prevotellaceae bacterium]
MKTQKTYSDEEILTQIRNAKQEVYIPQTLENDLNTLIDKWANGQTARAQTSASPSKWFWAGGIAASLAIIVSLGLYFQKNSSTQQYSDNLNIKVENLNVADKQKVATAERALILVSANYNKGLSSLHNAETHIKQAQNAVNKSFKKNKL